MKTFLEKIMRKAKRLVNVVKVGGGLLLASVMLPGAAVAQVGPLNVSPYYSYRSFGATNIVTGGTTLTSWPTNVASAGTNSQYAFLSTGGPVFIGDVDTSIEFICSGFLTNNSATNIINMQLVAASPIFGRTPTWNGINTTTNSGVNDWSTNVYSFTIPLASTVNGWFTYHTNILLNSTTLANAEWIGIYQAQPLGTTALWNVPQNLVLGGTNNAAYSAFGIGVKIKPVHAQ